MIQFGRRIINKLFSLSLSLSLFWLGSERKKKKTRARIDPHENGFTPNGKRQPLSVSKKYLEIGHMYLRVRLAC